MKVKDVLLNMRIKVKDRHALTELPDGTVSILCIRPPKNQKGEKIMDIKTYFEEMKIAIEQAEKAYEQKLFAQVHYYLGVAYGVSNKIRLIIKKGR